MIIIQIHKISINIIIIKRYRGSKIKQIDVDTVC